MSTGQSAPRELPRYRDYFEPAHLHPKYWPTWLGVGLLWLIAQLPFDTLLRLGRGLGLLVFYLLPSRRDTTLTNLALAFPELTDEARHRLARENYRHVGMVMTENAALWFRPATAFIDRFKLQGLQHLDAALAQEKGVILLQAHFTLLEFSAAVMSQHYRISAVYGASKNAMFGALLRYKREFYLQSMIGNRDIKSMVRRLRKGEIVWYSPDQFVTQRNGGIPVNFFSHPAMTTPGTARIARMTGAAVVPMLPTRLPGGKYTLTFFEPLDIDGDDPVAATQKVNDLFEDHVRQQREQYVWMHKRWKPIDANAPSPYRK